MAFLANKRIIYYFVFQLHIMLYNNNINRIVIDQIGDILYVN